MDWKDTIKRLKGVHTMSMPNNIIVLDIETSFTLKDDVQFHTFKLGWTVYVSRDAKGKATNESWHYWSNPTLLWKYVDNSVRDKSALYLFGNNIYFDLQAGGFFKYFAYHGWKLNFIYDNGLTYILVITCGQRTIKVLSLTNYFEASVKELGELIGIPKIDVNFDTISDSDLSIYCFRDVVICLDTMMNYFTFLESHDLGEFSLSRASQSLKAYRHRFMHENIFVHESENIFELERSAYYGGRTECFNIGVQTGGPFVCYDINSLYPYVMRNKLFPVKPIDYESSISINALSKRLMTYGCIAHVVIKTETPCYPVRIKGKVVFPIGEFDTYLCTDGLKDAIRRDDLREVRKIVTYQMADIFSDYIDYFYAIRQEAKRTGNKIMDKYAKMFMNSLYGKFGQQVPYSISKTDAPKGEYSREEIVDAETRHHWIVTRILGKEIVEYGKHKTNTTIMAIPAHVTEYARFILWSIIEDIGRERVIYCDTDSIWIRKSDAARVKWPISQDALGSLKVEQETERFEVYCPKDYVTDTSVKIKGIPKKAVKLSDSDYEYWTFQRQRSHLIKQVAVGYRVKKVRKHLSRKYDKGQVMSDGRVIPWVFSLQTPAPFEPEPEPDLRDED